MLFPTGLIRRELAALMPRGRICHATWSQWRRAAEISGRKTDRQGWIRLCAACALHKQGKAVQKWSIRSFLRWNGDDPLEFLPGIVPIDAPSRLPGSVRGVDLPELFFEWLGIRRSEDTIARWCQRAGLSYSRGSEYSREQLILLLCEYGRTQRRRRIAALQNLGVSA